MLVGAFCRRSIVNSNVRFSSRMVTMLDDMVQNSPMREAVRYTNKNMKWSAGDLKKQIEAHANALIEYGFTNGENVALWHKDGAEKHVTFLAAAKIGLKVVDIDTSINTVPDLRQALSIANCKAIVFEPQTDTTDNLLLLRKAIPEFFFYDDTYGQPFHSKHFPKLEMFIHTGFDLEFGCINYKGIFLPNPEVNKSELTAAKLTDSTPLYVQIKKTDKGVVASEVFTHGQVLEQSSWTFAKKFINKEYFEL